MLARNPLVQVEAWTDLVDGRSDLIRDGKPVGGIYRYFGRWYPQIVPAGAHSPTTRRTLDSAGYESRLSAQVRVEDAVAALEADPRALDALLSGRRVLLPGGPGRDPNDEHRLTKTQLV